MDPICLGVLLHFSQESTSASFTFAEHFLFADKAPTGHIQASEGAFASLSCKNKAFLFALPCQMQVQTEKDQEHIEWKRTSFKPESLCQGQMVFVSKLKEWNIAVLHRKANLMSHAQVFDKSHTWVGHHVTQELSRSLGQGQEFLLVIIKSQTLSQKKPWKVFSEGLSLRAWMHNPVVKSSPSGCPVASVQYNRYILCLVLDVVWLTFRCYVCQWQITFTVLLMKYQRERESSPW